MQHEENTLTRKAYAKINLGLDVLRRLDNGYHEVRMVMQSVGIFDVLTFAETETGIRITTDCGELPVDESNLIYKAARLLEETCGITRGVTIHLEKHIPIAAGMAGGSADAAATLLGLRELFSLELTDEQLRQLGAKVGADVPYCIMGGTALAEGIGEVLTPLFPAPRCSVLVAKPGISVSTRYVYEHLDAMKAWEHPDIDGMCGAIAEGNLAGVACRLGNVLETVTISEYPVIARIKQGMLDTGAMGSLMSGSGPTVFGIYESREQAQAACAHLAQQGLAEQLFVTEFI